MIHPIYQVFCTIFSALSESASISNEFLLFGSPFSALICLSPLYIAFYNAKSYRESAFIFGLQTFLVHLTSSFWLANFRGFAFFTLGASALGTAAEGALCGTILYAFPSNFCAEKNLREKSGLNQGGILLRILWFSAGWICYEFIKSSGTLGYPWGTLSMAAYHAKIFTQISDITGTFGVSFLYAIFSAVVAEGILLCGKNFSAEEKKFAFDRFFYAFKIVIFLFALAGIYGTVQILYPRTAEKNFWGVIVQQNVDPWEGGDEKSIEISMRLTEESLNALKNQGIRADIVIWSEGVLSKNFPQARKFYSWYPEDESLEDFIKKAQVPFLIGGGTTFDRSRKKRGNSAILFDRDGKFAGSYNKIQLVPFAERIPFDENPLMQLFMEKTAGFSSALTPGFQYVTFEIPVNRNKNSPTPLNFAREKFESVELDENGKSDAKKSAEFLENPAKNPRSFVKFSTPICFEDAFPSVCAKLFNAGSEIFINITNDAWSKTRSAEIQHFIAASYLATEFRTTLVRAANAGFSVVVDPAGKILWHLPLFEEKSAAVEIPVFARRHTIFSVWGNWFCAAAIFFVLLYIIFSILRRANENHDLSGNFADTFHAFFCGGDFCNKK